MEVCGRHEPRGLAIGAFVIRGESRHDCHKAARRLLTFNVISPPPITAVRKFHSPLSDMACSASLALLASFHRRGGRSTAGAGAARLAAIPAGESPANRRVQLLL